jgi:hypothetical protein
MNSIFQLDRANSKGEGGPVRKELSAFHYPDPADELDEDGTVISNNRHFLDLGLSVCYILLSVYTLYTVGLLFKNVKIK